MASSRLSLFLFVLVHALLFVSTPVSCNGDDEDNLFQELNSYRKSLNLSVFKENENANCIALEISNELEDEPCSSAGHYPIVPGNGPKFPNFEKLISKCDIDNETTTDGVILPLCAPKYLDLVLDNYTHHHTQFSQFLNDSKYTGAGVGSENDWMVVVLSTDSQNGTFARGAASLVAIGMVHYIIAMLLGLFLVLL